MTQKTALVLLALLGAGGAAGVLLFDRVANACTDCDPPAAETTQEGAHCTLSAQARELAASEFAALNKRALKSLNTTIVANYEGDKATLKPILEAIIERETSCCAHLTLSMSETERGYQVTVNGGREAISEMKTILSASGDSSLE